MNSLEAKSDQPPKQWHARPENLLLYDLSRQEMSGAYRDKVRRLCESQDLDWELIYSSAQNIRPLIAQNLTQCGGGINGMPQSIKGAFVLAAMQNAVFVERQQTEFLQVARFFQDHGMDVMPVKGMALDLTVYREPWYTQSGDVDVLLRYSRSGSSKIDLAEVHAFFLGIKGCFECEIRHHDLNIVAVLPVDFDLIWRDASPLVFRGARIFLACPEDQLLLTSLNCFRKGIFSLRRMCDVAEIINTVSNIRWNFVAERARRFKCAGVLYAVLFSICHTVGTCREIPLEALAVTPARAALIRALSKGLAEVSVCLNRDWRSKFKRHAFRILLWLACFPFSLYPKCIRYMLTWYIARSPKAWIDPQFDVPTVRSSSSVCRFQ
jgi:hypothetical protein